MLDAQSSDGATLSLYTLPESNKTCFEYLQKGKSVETDGAITLTSIKLILICTYYNVTVIGHQLLTSVHCL